MENASRSILEGALPPKAVVTRARAAFRDRFGSEAHMVALAPGRVNLIGEHTDYNGGFVLPMAIDRVTAVAVAPGNRAGRWRIHAADLGQDAELTVSSPLQPRAKGLWASYVAGVASGFQALAHDSRGAHNPALPALDLAIASSVPMGSGLSSSAALEVAVATAVEGILDSPLERLGKARLCQRAEHQFAGVPCGLMDQLASITGRAGHALLIDCRSNEVTPLRMPGHTTAIVLVIDSGVRHDLGDSEYPKRRAACESAAARLGVSQLRDVRPADLLRQGGVLTPEERRCAGHVVHENARVLEAVQALRASDLHAFGRLMAASHESLRNEFRVSCRELDAIVEELGEVPGVFGARMTGAGFGGCVVALLPPQLLTSVCAAITGLARAAFVVQPSAGARLLRL